MPKDLDRKFWDRIARKYSRQPIANQAAYEKKLEKTREYFTAASRVLEFGCGTGSTAILHAEHVAQIDAIDISPKMVEIAEQKRADAQISNLNFAVDTIESFDGRLESYDVILGLSILHLLKDKEAALAKVYSLLKTNGVFISSTVCMGEKMGIFRLIGPLGRVLGLLPRLDVFTAEQLRECLLQAGFSIEYDWQPEKSMAVFIVARKSG